MDILTGISADKAAEISDVLHMSTRNQIAQLLFGKPVP